MSTRYEQLVALIEPVVTALGCELWGVEYQVQGRQALLRVYIDRPEQGVVVEDCERVSRQLSSLLDVEDPIKTEYTLEVSSPGLDRPLYTLPQFEQYVGEDVSLKLRFPFEGRRKFKGRLSGVESQDVLLIAEGHEYSFPIESIEKANVVPRF